VCRSPFAAALLDRYLRDSGNGDVRVSSAGFFGHGRRAPDIGRTVAEEFGVDLSRHESRLVTGHAMQHADLILVMSPGQVRDARWRGAPPGVPIITLGDLDPVSTESRTIRDPWNCGEDVFRSSYSRIDRCLRDFVRILNARSPHN